MGLQEDIIELIQMESILIDVILILILSFIHPYMQSKRSYFIYIKMIDILVFLIFMLMQHEREYSSMETQQISYQNRFRYVFYLKYYRLIVKYSSIRLLTLLKIICMLRIEMIVFLKKVLEEWRSTS